MQDIYLLCIMLDVVFNLLYISDSWSPVIFAMNKFQTLLEKITIYQKVTPNCYAIIQVHITHNFC